MNSWADTNLHSGLIPEGKRELKITDTRIDQTKNGLLQGVVDVRDDFDGTLGQVTIPLQTWSKDAEATWARMFKRQAVGLGYAPPAGSEALPMAKIMEDFEGYLIRLPGRLVQAHCVHVESDQLRDDGKPFVNHRVTFAGIIAARVPTQVAVPEFAAV